MQPKYPNIKVKLSGQDGNVFSLLGIMIRALQKGGLARPEIEAFKAEALNGDYDHFLQTAMKWVDVS